MSRSRVQLYEAAAIGHRITHEDDLPPPQNLITSALIFNEQVAAGGASFSARLSASLGRLRRMELEMEYSDPGDCPSPTGTIELGSEDTFVGRELMGAAIVHEDHVVDCRNDSDGPIAQGAMDVYVNGHRWARRNDELECGARIGEGERTVLVGGTPSEYVRREIPPLDNQRLGRLGPHLGQGIVPRIDAATGVRLGESLVRTQGSIPQRTPRRQISGARIGRAIASGRGGGHISAILSGGQ